MDVFWSSSFCTSHAHKHPCPTSSSPSVCHSCCWGALPIKYFGRELAHLVSRLLSFGVRLGTSHFHVALSALIPLQITHRVHPFYRNGFLFGQKQLIMEKHKGRMILEPWLEQYGGVFAVLAPLGSSTGYVADPKAASHILAHSKVGRHSFIKRLCSKRLCRTSTTSTLSYEPSPSTW
jgi:hypothetical protein